MEITTTYVYANNFRGFKKAIIPLQDVNFLVGENSSGKSSFLKLCALVSEPHFSFEAKISSKMISELGSFSDMLSVSAGRSKSFQVGIITKLGDSKSSRVVAIMAVSFIDSERGPKAAIVIRQNELGCLIVDNSRQLSEYLVLPNMKIDNFSAATLEAHVAFLFRYPKLYPNRFKKIPKELSQFSGYPILAQALTRRHFDVRLKSPIRQGRSFYVPEPLVYISPIRSEPRKIYQGATDLTFSSTGEHTPSLLSLLFNSKRSKEVQKRLDGFGSLGGLFDHVRLNPYGSRKLAPFEILVKLESKYLNIKNIGYGVSQLLPILVEILARPKSAFAIQQPEVHLHPRAQSAFGKVVYVTSAVLGSQFIVETHSDFVIDSYRHAIKKSGQKVRSQVLFFERTKLGNRIHRIQIANDGKYVGPAVSKYRDFFIREQFSLLEI